ncbi:MAG: hypothetical protein ACOC1F_08170 [Myxococcota bacterium]
MPSGTAGKPGSNERVVRDGLEQRLASASSPFRVAGPHNQRDDGNGGTIARGWARSVLREPGTCPAVIIDYTGQGAHLLDGGMTEAISKRTLHWIDLGECGRPFQLWRLGRTKTDAFALRYLLGGWVRTMGQRGDAARDWVRSVAHLAHEALRASGDTGNGERSAANLVYDLIEEHRAPYGDRNVWSLLGRGFKPALEREGCLTVRLRRILASAWHRTASRETRAGKRKLNLRGVLRQQTTTLAAIFRDGVGPCSPIHFPW